MIYYAHSMKLYGSARERKELKLLNQYFQEKIFNPNQRKIQKAKEPMHACIEMIRSPLISGIVFSTIHNYISAGVYFELKVAKKQGIPIFFLRDGQVEPFRGAFRMIGKNRHSKWAKVVTYASENG